MSVRMDWSRFWLPLVGSWLWLIGTTNLAEAQFVFRDVGDEAGLFPHVSKIAEHSAAWGDIDGDGWPDLYVATFGGQPKALLGVREISASCGYTSGQESIAHFGLGAIEKCDIEVVLPHGRGRSERRDVPANQRFVIAVGSSTK